MEAKVACPTPNVPAIVALSAVFALMAGSARADNISKTVAANGVLVVAHYAQVNPDCSSMGMPVVRLSAAPSHGVVRTIKTSGFSRFTGSYENCNSRRVAGVTAEYRPERAFVGADSFSLDVIFPGGREREEYFSITVK
jgi:hypothetical protein